MNILLEKGLTFAIRFAYTNLIPISIASGLSMLLNCHALFGDFLVFVLFPSTVILIALNKSCPLELTTYNLLDHTVGKVIDAVV